MERDGPRDSKRGAYHILQSFELGRKWIGEGDIHGKLERAVARQATVHKTHKSMKLYFTVMDL